MSKDVDFIIIAQSEVVNYGEYSKLPLDRIELYRELVYPRMVYFQGAFRSHIDVLNILKNNISYLDASFKDRRRLLSIWNLPALSGMHIANYLLSEGVNTCIINNFDSEWDRFCDVYITNSRPPLVGISTTFHLSFSEIGRICKKLRDFDPDMEIVAGGAYANTLTHTSPVASFEKPMRRFGIDYVLHGFHSEADLRDLLSARNGNGDLDKVFNLSYINKKGGQAEKFMTTDCQWNQPLIDDTPALWDKLDLPFVNHTVQMRTSCGCPFSCSFCSYPVVARGFQTMTPEAIEKSIKSVLRIPGVNRIVFIDDTFNVPKARFKEMCKVFSKYDFKWYSFLRVQFADEDSVKLMRDSGCSAVYLGIESANDRILSNMNKRAKRVDFERGVGLLHKNSIKSIGAFIIGFPGETSQSIRENQEFIESTGMEFYTLKEFYYMEHTKIHSDCTKFGLTGMGNKWSHDTMDSSQAYKHKIELFKEIMGPCFVDPDSSLWHIVLLQDAGYSFDEIAAIQREINTVVADQLNGILDDSHPAFDRIRDILKKCERTHETGR